MNLSEELKSHPLVSSLLPPLLKLSSCCSEVLVAVMALHSAGTTKEVSSSTKGVSTFPPSSVQHDVSIKLSAKNYLLWRAQFKPFLYAYDLFEFMDGSSSAPPHMIIANGVSSPNPVFVLWHKLDQLVLSG